MLLRFFHLLRTLKVVSWLTHQIDFVLQPFFSSVGQGRKEKSKMSSPVSLPIPGRTDDSHLTKSRSLLVFWAFWSKTGSPIRKTKTVWWPCYLRKRYLLRSVLTHPVTFLLFGRFSVSSTTSLVHQQARLRDLEVWILNDYGRRTWNGSLIELGD